MATHADRLNFDESPGGSSLTAFVDRWIYFISAAFITSAVLIGFIPDAIGMVGAVRTGHRPPLPVAMHLHAMLMGSWMLLLLAQTYLMATGKRALHMQFGVLGMFLAPALVVAGLILVPTNLRAFVAFSATASPEIQTEIAVYLHVMTNIALLQFKIAACFLPLVWLGIRARRRDSGLHKRLMILATTVPLPAAFDRMTFIPHTMPGSPLSTYLWPLLCVAPMLLWDIYRGQGIHRAYWIYAAFMVPFSILTSLLWDSPWWHTVMPPILYG